MGAMAVGIVVDGINAVLEKREGSAVHRKVGPGLWYGNPRNSRWLALPPGAKWPILCLTCE